MTATVEPHFGKSLVIGASGLVGGYIVQHLKRSGEQPFALSRLPRNNADALWFQGDLAQPAPLKFPPFATLYCTASAVLLAQSLPHLFNPSLNRVIVFTTTSIATKLNSEIAAEREGLQKLADAEQKIAAACEQHGIEWTILRPTLIYDPGRDPNITPLSRLIRKFGFMPLVGGAPGLRQPVHAEDLAIGAILAASSAAAANKIYSLPGGETLSYREMIGRIFDGLGQPRRTVSIPLSVWKAGFIFAKPLFPTANVAMGTRMMKDMVFDHAPAAQDFGWKPRTFHPMFD